MVQSKYDRLPRAGDLEQEHGTEVFYLAPRPVPTGINALSIKTLLKVPNTIYMDIIKSPANVEFGIRGWIGSAMAILLFFAITGIGMGVYQNLNYNLPIFGIALEFISPNWPIWGVIGLISAISGYLLLRTIQQLTIHPPIRFNRQRREVAYIAKRGQPPRFVPWEEVIACVTSSKVITQHGTHNSFSLMIGLRDSGTGDMLWVTVPTGSLMLAVSEWEAIRGYMEQGLSALPQAMDEVFEEGTVAHFQLCRETYRENHWYVTYLLGFILIQFCSGWTLPCHIAAWVERLPKASFPKAVRDWSKPLPPEQWAKPSDELIEQSKAVRESFRQGYNLFEHFRREAKKREATDA